MVKSSSQNLGQAQLTNEVQLLQNLFLGQLSVGGGAIGGATGGSGSGSPGTAPASVLELLLGIIPIAQEGHVISSEYHNSLRAALLALASAVGVTTGTPVGPQDVTVTLAPAFFPANPESWQTVLGIAGLPGGQSFAQGWLPVELPDGALVKSMTVIGRKNGKVDSFDVNLGRQSITDDEFDEMIITHLANSPQSYNVTKSMLGTGGLNEIDNKKYKYLIEATVTRPGETDDLVQIFAIQLLYTTP